MRIIDSLLTAAAIFLIAALMQFIVVRQCDTFGKFFYWHNVYQCEIDTMAPETLRNLTTAELIRFAENKNVLTDLERELLTRLTKVGVANEKPVRKK